MRYFGDTTPSNWLIRPIASLPQRVVLDANVLLDLVLISDGIARLTIDQLRSLEARLFTSKQAVEEAKTTLHRYMPHVDLSGLIDGACKRCDIEITSSARPLHAIKAHDLHIASVAAEIDGILVTDDLALIGEMNEAQLHARTLREIAVALCLPHEPRQDLLVFGTGLGADGYLFIKCEPDLLLTASNHRSFFIFDVAHFGTLAFNSRNRTFEFTAESNGQIVAAKLHPMPGQQLAILLEYSVGRTDTVIWLRVRNLRDGSQVQAEARIPALQRAPSQDFIFLNRRQRDLGWSGTISNASYGPNKLTPRTWQVCSSLVGVAPSVLTADLAQFAALLVQMESGRVACPSLESVRKFAALSIPHFRPGRRRHERAEHYLPHPAWEWLEREYGPDGAKQAGENWRRWPTEQ